MRPPAPSWGSGGVAAATPAGFSGLGADVRPYIPNRVDEGYGLNLRALAKLYNEGVRLVVTVDCGIRAVDEVDQARRLLELVITDHHTVGPELPFALIINAVRIAR